MTREEAVKYIKDAKNAEERNYRKMAVYHIMYGGGRKSFKEVLEFLNKGK